VSCVAFLSDGKRLASTSPLEGTRLWNLQNGTSTQPITEPRKYISAATFGSDSRLLAVAGGDYAVHVWDTVTAKELAVLEGHTQLVRSIAFDPYDALIASGGDDEMVILWKVRDLWAVADSPK
jgi:WD40 repeat protein